MDGEGVPQIVKPRLIASLVMTQQAGADTRADKRVFGCLTLHRSSRAGNQQPCVWPGRVVHRVPDRITGQSPDDISTTRHDSRLVKLAFAKREDSASEIDVAECEGKRLADAQPGAVQQ